MQKGQKRFLKGGEVDTGEWLKLDSDFVRAWLEKN
jgi:hypothetical protein